MTRQEALKILELNAGKYCESVQEAIKTIVQELPLAYAAGKVDGVAEGLTTGTDRKLQAILNEIDYMRCTTASRYQQAVLDLIIRRLKATDKVDINHKCLDGIKDDDIAIPGRDFIPIAWVEACQEYGKWRIVKVGDEQTKIDAVKAVLEKRISILKDAIQVRMKAEKDTEWYEGKRDGYIDAHSLLNESLKSIKIELAGND